MDTTELRTLLFRSAVLATACDGEVHDTEIEELRRMAGVLPYFDGVDVKEEVDRVLQDAEGQPEAAAERHFELLARTPMKERQKFVALEALLAVIAADGVLHPAEVSFLRRTKAALGVEDGAFVLRFPEHSAILLEDSNEGGFTRPPESLLDDDQFADGGVS